MSAAFSQFFKNKINIIACRNYAKEIKFGNEGKNLLLKGAETLANVVSITLGPKAGNVIVGSRNPKISKDGAFVANSIALSNPYENVGVQVMKKLAENTNQETSNSTKIATVLAIEIAKQGYRKVTQGSNPVQIRKGVLDAAKAASNYLDGISKKLETSEDVRKIATIFAKGDDKLGKVVADAIELVGKDGVITVKECEEVQDVATLSRGMVLQSGIYMCNFPLDKSGRIKLENTLLLVYNNKIEDFRTLASSLEIAVAKHKHLIILAEDFSPNIGVTFAVNNEAIVGVKFITVKIPGDKDFDKDILKDLAYGCGGKVFGDEACGKKSNKIDESYFGKVDEVILTKNEMICIHENSELISEKISDLKSEIKDSEDEEQKKRLKDRLNRLEANIAIISIDGTDKEIAKEYKDKIYSVIESTRTAIEEGVVPGAGVALVRCAKALSEIDSTSDDHKLGVKIVSNSLTAPFNTIIKNSQEQAAPILNKIQNLPLNIGYDVVNQSYVDAYEEGIVDCTKSIKCALNNAANTASLIVNAEAVVVYKFDGTEIVL